MYTSLAHRVQDVLATDEAVRQACPSLSGAIHRHDDGVGYWADCPTCEASGYVSGRVCRDCFGAGDQYGETIADLVDLLTSL